VRTDAERRRQTGCKHIFAISGASEFLDAIHQLIDSESFDVTTTNFVPEMFEQISAAEPDLITIDLAVHIQADWDLLERLHGDVLTRGMPVIIDSTHEASLERAAAKPTRWGGQRFIGKPLDIADELAAVDQLIWTA
jgi:DNA-binding NtrC family response regulator